MSVRKLSASLASSKTSSTPGAYLFGFGSAYATSVTIPTHQAGDIIVIYARAGGNNVGTTPPTAGGTVPTWTQIVQGGASGFGISRAYFCVATTDSHTSGTFTNASGMTVAVVRRASGIGASAGLQQVTQSPWIAPAVTLTKSNNTSVVLHFFGWGDTVNAAPTTFSAGPQGYTQRFMTRTGLVALGLVTKNVTDCAPAANITAAANIYASHITIEVLAS
jgi:hypothetical protein